MDIITIKKSKLLQTFSFCILISLIFSTVSCKKEALNKAKKQSPPPRPPKAQETSVRTFPSLDNDYGLDDFKLYSPAVNKKGELLKKYKCEKKAQGIEKSIPLKWENVPEKAESLAIVMYHYPHPNDHNHVNSYLLLWGIDPSVNKIPYGKADKGDWYMGSNKDGNMVSYTSPCSHGPGSHEYIITIFALSEIPKELPGHSSLNVNFEKFMTAVENTTIIGKAELRFTDKKE